MNEQITIVGGGLAGLTAAVAAAESGVPVVLHEATTSLGGRASTTEPPFRANDGTHAFYSDGAPGRWLTRRGLLQPAAKLSTRAVAKLRMRHRGELHAVPPRVLAPLITKRRLRAPVDRSFADWGGEHLGAESTAALGGFAGIITYDADPGRLSAAFVWERVLRASAPRWPAVRYPQAGWGSLVDRLAAAARDRGVRIETGSRVDTLPDAPVIVATDPDTAARLLDGAGQGALPRPESGRAALLDLGLRADRRDLFAVSDLDEGGFVERYSLPDPQAAPEGHSLVQCEMPLRPGESRDEGIARLEAVCDLALPDWRERTVWRRARMTDRRTGALDLPGTTWQDRPAIDRGDGVCLAGDNVAAPGLLSEVAINSGIEAASLAVQVLTARQPASRG